jgi:hypothetical protein
MRPGPTKPTRTGSSCMAGERLCQQAEDGTQHRTVVRTVCILATQTALRRRRDLLRGAWQTQSDLYVSAARRGRARYVIHVACSHSVLVVMSNQV